LSTPPPGDIMGSMKNGLPPGSRTRGIGMLVLLDGAPIPPGRMIFFPKHNFASHQLDIEADGPVGLFDRGDLYAIRNYDRTVTVTVTVRVKKPAG